MKTICWLWVVLIFSLWLPGAPKAQEMAIGLAGKDQRKAVGVPEIFNNDWDFHKGDIANGILAVESEKDWRKLNLPHDWSIEGPFSEEWASATAYLPSGIAWYKKTFKMDRHWKGKQIQIYFDGVYKNSEVWINGHFLGKRPNGFIPFYYDLTPYLKSRGENTIAVKVDHREFADSRWYTGSGIYRNVYLIVQNPVHIGLWDVAFSTPKVSKEAATVK
ncbi:MAG TPA: beta galactosidase jelly roll domain-containing protein, partial [Arachidicoccus sp.]|nr:beta galactosidase jelly roll domain-containing protein [Arachidicoccus sp.]